MQHHRAARDTNILFTTVFLKADPAIRQSPNALPASAPPAAAGQLRRQARSARADARGACGERTWRAPESQMSEEGGFGGLEGGSNSP